jgi:dihydrofolate reductase
MWNLMSLDGRFEGPSKWDLWFHELVWGDELERYSLAHDTDMLLFGRVTYQGMADYWSKATGPIADFMNSVKKVVFSRTLKRADWSNSTLVTGDAAEAIAGLKTQSGRDMMIFGSAELSADLMQHELIDEYRLCVAPVVLGDGTPLFKPMPKALKMELLGVRPLKTGGVILNYRPEGWR